jgi:HSP20 family protein
MFGLTRWNPADDIFGFHREVDRLFNQFWNDLPNRTAADQSPSFQVSTTDEGWRIDVPLPGIDPLNVNLEVAGNTVTIRAEESSDNNAQSLRYEQTFTVPAFLDIERIAAAHKHGMLRLTVPLKDSVKPRRIQIEGIDEKKRIASAA